MGMPRAVVLAVFATGLAVGALPWSQATGGPDRSSRRFTPIAEAVAHAAPAVVSVNSWRGGARGMVRSSGAGVIVHPDGYVVTNSHVVDGGRRFSVELFGGIGVLEASLVVDEPGADLAILKLQRPGGFKHVSLCPSKSLMLGETAIAIGNPHGLGDSITVGVVSAVGRTAKMQSGVALRNLIQTDASINTGNSGGALLNLDGELIGINVSLLPSATGIAFAICADDVEVLLRRATGRTAPSNALPTQDEPEPAAEAVRPPMDVIAKPKAAPPTPRATAPRPAPTPAPAPAPLPRATVTPLRPSDLGFDLEDNGARVVVSRVDRLGAAGIAGLRESDVLLAIDGRPIEAAIDLLLAFSASRPGREYFLSVRRAGQPIDVVLVAPK
jgi:S1-C subfamily serine protease